jgi:tRNA pseudouridine13 synthase
MDTEAEIGISGYISSLAGFRGRIKNTPEDFSVDEIPKLPPASEDGKYLIFKARIRNWDTNRFVIELARHLGISKKLITYAGTKDKNAVKTQYFCINTVNNFPENFYMKDVEILDSFRSKVMLRLGDLVGNTFTIRIYSNSIMDDRINAINEEIAAKGGFPNFFGPQRFGSSRPITHRVGRFILESDFHSALMEYLVDPRFDHEEYRMEFLRTGDVKRALESYPQHLGFERTILNHLNSGQDEKDVFKVFPRNLSTLFVHAYQSYLFNLLLSIRLERFGNLWELFEGDVAYPVDVYFNADKDNPIPVTKYNLEKMNSLSKKDSVRPTIPVFGYDSKLSDGYQGELERKILEDQKISLSSFRVPGMPELSSKGERRITSAKPVSMNVSNNVLSFSLGRGIYATSLIREYFKKDFMNMGEYQISPTF